jgi:hypothetical protein
MVPLPDLSPYSDAVIKNSADSTHKLRVCQSWSERTCAKSSPRGDLKPGEDSATKFGWKDTDGFDQGDGWVKQHGCFRCVVTVTS